MKNRNVILVILFSIITLFIYGIVWFVKTKNELNKRGANIPTAWLIIIPLVNIYWAYKYFEAVEKETNGKLNAILMLILGVVIIMLIPMAIAQDAFNKIEEGAAQPGAEPQPQAAAPEQTAQPEQPETPPSTPVQG